MKRIMRARTWFAIVLSALAVPSCRKAPFFAVDGATLIISADKSYLRTGGERAVITVMGFNEDGEPLHDHMQVTFTATMGTIPGSVELMDGRATVEFNSGDLSGTAEIRARSGSVVATPDPLSIAIGAGALDTLTIHADPAQLPPGGGNATVSVYAFDAAMNLLADVPVILSASSGELERGNAIRFTDSSGRIRETFFTTEQATVRAESGSKSAEVEVVVGTNQLPNAEFLVSPSSVKVGEKAYFNGALSTDSDGRIVTWEWNFGDGGSGRGETIAHAFANAGTYSATLKVTDDDGGSDACEKSIVVTE